MSESDPSSSANPAVYPDAARLYAERLLMPMLYRWRGFWVALAFFLIAMVEALALVILLPLKQTIPYIVQVEKVSGRVLIDPQPLGVFHPQLQNIAYFIHVWARHLLSIDEHSLSEGLPRAASWLEGSAVNEFKAFVRTVKPAQYLADRPGFRRSIHIESTNWLHGNHTCLLEVSLADTEEGVEKKQQRFVMSVEYHLMTPGYLHVDQDNPMGLVITHFSLSPLQ